MKIAFSFCLILSVTSVIGCNTINKPPNRKGNIPIEAHWHGGVDGGVWIAVKSVKTINNFKIQVYNENDGSLIASGLYKLKEGCFTEKLTAEELERKIEGFDGETILLSALDCKNKYCSLELVK